MEKLHRITEYTLNNFKSAIDAGTIIYDVDLQKWGLNSENILGLKSYDLKHLTGGCGSLNELTE